MFILRGILFIKHVSMETDCIQPKLPPPHLEYRLNTGHYYFSLFIVIAFVRYSISISLSDNDLCYYSY